MLLIIAPCRKFGFLSLLAVVASTKLETSRFISVYYYVYGEDEVALIESEPCCILSNVLRHPKYISNFFANVNSDDFVMLKSHTFSADLVESQRNLST